MDSKKKWYYSKYTMHQQLLAARIAPEIFFDFSSKKLAGKAGIAANIFLKKIIGYYF
jgi:hypothetical protein